MKLSEEQKDVVTERNGQYFINGNYASYDEVIVSLRASEQAWKEEAETYKEGYEVYKQSLSDLFDQYKHAVEVLEWYANPETYKRAGNGIYTIISDEGWNARNFLSSLSEDKP